MNYKSFNMGVLVCLLLCSGFVNAQDGTHADSRVTSGAIVDSTTNESSVPRVLKFSGTLKNLEVDRPSEIVSIQFAIYSRKDSVTPLWVENQNVNVSGSGKFTVLLGATKPEGIPQEIFSTGEARWIGLTLAEQSEQTREILVSVPYALNAASATNAEYLAGRPASAYMLAPASGTASTIKEATGAHPEVNAAAPVNTGTADGSPNYLAKFDSATSIINSAVFEAAGNVGIGTSTPATTLELAAPKSSAALLSLNNTGTAGGAGITFKSGSVVATNRNWSIVHNDFAYGDFSIRESNAVGGDPITAGIGRFLISPDGNVGIGTPTPGSNLEVAAAKNSSPLLVLNNTGSAGGSGVTFQSASPVGTNRNWSIVHNDFAYGDLSIRQSLSVGGNPITAGISRLLISNSGNVGIGTTSPGSSLEVAGIKNAAPLLTLNNTGTGGGSGITFASASSVASNRNWAIVHNDFAYGDFSIRQSSGVSGDPIASGVSRFMISNIGNVGIGNTAPLAKLDVSQAVTGSGSFSVGAPPPSAIHGDVTATTGFISGVFGTTSSTDGFGVLGENLASGQGTGHSAGVRGITANTTALGTGVWGDALQTSGDNVGVFGHSSSDTGTGVQGLADAVTGDAVGVYGRSNSTTGAGIWGEATAGTSVTIGTAILAGVYGKISATGGAAGLFDTVSSGDILIGRAGASATKVFRVSSTGAVFGNGAFNTSGADFAESVAVTDVPSKYEPGDVLAIDVTGTRRFTKIAKPYSTLVAGIYSTRPGVLASPHQIDDPRIVREELPLAIVGIVPCKVTDENGAINTGDLLVSSSTVGYAMKGTDRGRMTGAVIGKALQSLTGKSGIIEVLVSLQ